VGIARYPHEATCIKAWSVGPLHHDDLAAWASVFALSDFGLGSGVDSGSRAGFFHKSLLIKN
jgi:hypothetical protein